MSDMKLPDMPPRHDADVYDAPRWKRREAELAEKVREASELRMDRLHGKVKAGGVAGSAVAALVTVAELLQPGMLAALGLSMPLATMITLAASSVAAYLRGTTTEDLPTDIKKIMAEMEAPTWDEIIDYVEDDGRAISAEALELLRDKLDDEELQKMIVARVNADADIPVVPEAVEALGFNAAYDFAQGVSVPFLTQWADRVRGD